MDNNINQIVGANDRSIENDIVDENDEDQYESLERLNAVGGDCGNLLDDQQILIKKISRTCKFLATREGTALDGTNGRAFKDGHEKASPKTSI